MTSGDEKQPVILAAGGTGGHIFPAEALAEALLARGERVVLVTDQRFDQSLTGALSRVEKKLLTLRPPSGSPLRKILGVAGLVLGVFRAKKLLRSLQPRAVVGFGGYPSFPTVYAATKLGIPAIIHEQNSVLGRANRLLAHRVSRIAASFADMRMLAEKDKGKVVITGNPVRASVRALRHFPYAGLTQDGQMHLLVVGGSLGASVFSQVVPEAIAALPAGLRARIRIDQQCRAADLAATRAAYAALGVSADLAPFFVDVPARLAGSHLVIGRAGASTIAELAVAGRPAILVPLPTSMDNHQYFNAETFEDAGGGWVMTQDGFTPASLSARLEAFLTAPETLIRAAASAAAVGMPDAAERLADLVLSAAESGEDGWNEGSSPPCQMPRADEEEAA
ncbi:MAG: undecaprenyldiphospho-muramoylpentapeptide beta-N-acetylglucosaminyltransferase [Pseudomonadota bacterium]|nr:undecaprenyldiphospho-muramoylpentapeptide beta-N-acetylglucosaminyltransferase [Pseudomonadota bacterium]